MSSQRTVSDWKVWLLVWALGIAGIVAVMPYVIELQGLALRQAAAKASMSVPTILALSAVQGAVLLGICSRIGIWAARRVCLSFPILDAIAARKSIPWSGSAALAASLSGLVGGAFVVLIDVFVFAPSKAVALNDNQPAAWKGFLASFYGGVTEEIFLRLFLLSLLALGLRRLTLGADSRGRAVPSAAFWTANILAALAFGLGHLPATAVLAPLTPLLVVRAIVLNGVLALLFGALYRRYGLEMAILAHFSADIALHVVPPLVG